MQVETKSSRARNIQSSLMEKLKLPQPSTQSQSPVLSQTNFKNTISSIPQKSISQKKTKGSFFNKPQQKQQIKQVRIDDVGEAAEWIEIGTKNDDFDFEQEQPVIINDSPQISSFGYDKNAIRLKMQDKAKQLAKGGFRMVPSNANRLLQKAKGIRQQNQRLSPRKNELKQQVVLPFDINERIPNTPKNDKISSSKQVKNQIQKPIQNQQVNQLDSEQQDNKWNAINKQTIQNRQNQLMTKKLVYSLEQVKNYYLSLDLKQQKKQMNIENLSESIQQGGLFSFLGCLSKKKKINTLVKSQLLALTKVHISEDIDAFLLESLWKCLTFKSFNRFGNHWQQIGFQGHDPATDLRSTGILSLFLIYVYKETQQQKLKQIYKMSRDQRYNFPLMITLIKIVGKYIDLVDKNIVNGKNLEDYLQYFHGICNYTLKCIKQNEFDIESIGQGTTNILKNIQSKISKIKKQYRESHLQ